MANEEVPVYIARATCGCVIGATVDDGRNKKYVSEDVAEWIREGHTVEPATVGWVRANGLGHRTGCPHDVELPGEEADTAQEVLAL